MEENQKKRRPLDFQIEDEILVSFEKKAGEQPCIVRLSGKPPAAVLGGIEALILEFAARTGMGVHDVLSLIATDILAPIASGGGITQ